jgi:glyoxylase-like metal-dependent hydrolase (beta-lactamase superfamily II)
VESVEKLAENLFRIKVGSPTPFPVTNVYVLIRNGSPVLVDSGLNSDFSYSQLLNGLKGVGVGVEDTQAVFITHGHLDHAGLAERVSRDSGCTVFAQKEDFEMIGSWSNFIKKRIGELLEDLRRMGVTEEVFDSAQRYLSRVSKYDFSLKAEQVASETAEEYGIQPIAMPGHTHGSMGYVSIEHPGLLMSGDTVLDTLTSLLTDFESFLSTMSKLESFKRVEKLLPGHGEPLFPAEEWVQRTRAKYLGRVHSALNLISRPATLYTVSQGIYAKNFEDPAEFKEKLILIMQQTQVFLDYLVKTGRAHRFTSGGQVFFEARGSG